MKNSSEREVAVFGDARRLPVAERAAYLDRACADDAAVRQRVEELLLAEDKAEGFLQEPAPGANRPLSASTLVVNLAAPGEKAGDRIGRYKLLQQIGEGGCGVVYMAEQEEPVRRRVALKIIKLGMDTKQVIARFEAERQALAMMEHPNIAKVFDAGATERGRPYFVMELVRGIKITDYCDEHNLSPQDRLELFIQVCHAVQHAHQKGIIHRDLKPSNILVASNDGMPVPKVIDFGIAKATQGRLSDQTLFTAFEQFIGTPAYMSPEQAELTMQDVDTRTDIYSLGVLLYELLTGNTPFDAKELLAAGMDEMRRIIREMEPVKPSTRLSQESQKVAERVSQRVGESPTSKSEIASRKSQIDQDLDWIVMKCLEKERARRYETANGLGMDLQRYLADEPVLARPPSRFYEFRKTVRRHKFGFVAAATLITMLAAGVVVSTRLFIMESNAHQRALKAEQEAESERRTEATLRQRSELAERTATEELWRAYLAQARAARFSGQPGRRFDSLEAIRKAAAIRLAPELRDEAIACLALPDLKFQRRLDVKTGVFDHALQHYAALTTNSGNISIRRVKDDREISILPNSPGTVFEFGAFSHDGKYLPVLCHDNLLHIWELERQTVIFTVPCRDRARCADFQPDDRRLAIAATNAEISIYELPTGKKINSFSTPFVAGCVRYAPSGLKLAICSYTDPRVAIMDPNSGTVLKTMTNGLGSGTLAWHPDDALMAVPGHWDDLVYLWDTATGRLLHRLKGHQSTPSDVQFSPDGDILISSGWDGMHMWHARAGEHLMACGMSYGEHQSFSPDGATYSHSRYRWESPELFSFAAGRVARRWHVAEEDIFSKVIAFSPDGRWLAFGAGNWVKLFDARTGDLCASLTTGPTAGLCFQKSAGGLLVSGERGLFLWPIRAAAQIGEFSIGPPEAVGLAGGWQQARVSEDGQVFAAFHGGYVYVFEAEGMRYLARTPKCRPGGQPGNLSLSPDGRILTTGGHLDTVVRVWDARTGALIKELSDAEWVPEGSPYPAFAPKGGFLFTACWAGYRRWETNSWTRGPRFDRPEPDLVALAISHDGQMLAVREAQTSIQLLDAVTGEKLALLQSPIHSHVIQFAFSPDDTQLAVIHKTTRELLVWDLRLLREELAKMGLDWARPPYPLPPAETATKASQFRVRINPITLALPTGGSH